MKGLLLKDLYNMRIYGKSLLIILAFMIVFGIMMNNPFYICAMVIFFSFSASITVTTADESVHWDQYALTLPVSKKTMVQEKMVLAVALILGGGVIAAILGGTMLSVQGEGIEMLIWGCIIGVEAVLVMSSVVQPIVMKAGAEKARYAMMLVITVPAVLVVLGLKSAEGLGMNLINVDFNSLIRTAALGGIIVAVVALYFSYCVSLKIYGKKQW